MLTEQQAVEIYKLKLSLIDQLSYNMSSENWKIAMRGKSNPVSKKFGVSPRIVRDIWNRYTWGFATIPLWAHEPASLMGDLESYASSVKVFPVSLPRETESFLTFLVASLVDQNTCVSQDGQEAHAIHVPVLKADP